MGGPEKRLSIGSCDVLAVATIAGFEADAARIEAAFEAHRPDVVALGVPPEDLEGLTTLAEAKDPLELLPELSESEERFFELLARWGPSRVPSPDLEAVHRLATAAEVPMEALDMDDQTHSHVYIKQVGFRTVLRSGRLQKKVLLEPFEDAADPYDLARKWDAYQNNLKQLRRVEEMREDHMAGRLREVAGRGGRLLAIVPVARFDGIVAKVTAAPAPPA